MKSLKAGAVTSQHLQESGIQSFDSNSHLKLQSTTAPKNLTRGKSLEQLSSNLEQIIQIISTDDRLFQFVMKLVKYQVEEHFPSSSSASNSRFPFNQRQQLTQIIDSSIEAALDQIRLMDMLDNLIDNSMGKFMQASPQNSSDRSRSSNGLKIEDEDKYRYNYSNQIFIDVNGDEPENQEDELDIKPPSFSEKEPEKPVSQHSVKKTVQALNRHQKPPLAPSSAVPTAYSSHKQNKAPDSLFIGTDLHQDFSLGDSERNSFLSTDSLRESEASTVQITIPLDKSLPEKAMGMIGKPIFDDEDEIEDHQKPQEVERKESPATSLPSLPLKDPLINQSFQVTSETNSVQNSMEFPRKSAMESSDKTRENELEDENAVDINETVEDWGRKVIQRLQEEHQFEDDAEEEEEAFNRDSTKAHNDSTASRQSGYDSETFEVEEEDVQDGRFQSPKKYVQITSSPRLPSIHDYFSASYGGGPGQSNVVFFDQSQFDAEADAVNTGKSIKRVVFVDGIVSDVIYYERPGNAEARDMFYTHEELDRFDMHYRKEDAVAEKMGMTWMEWKNQQPDEVELSFSDEEQGHYEEDYNDDSFQF